MTKEITDYKVWKAAFIRENEIRKKAEKDLDEKTSEVLTSLMILEQQVKKETEKNAALQEANEKLAVAQSQLIQSEKMASLGQLSAGIAHEINNPLAFIRSYLQTLSEDWLVINNLLEWYESIKPKMTEANQKTITDYYAKNDIEFVREDFQSSLEECLSGVERIVEIVNQLQLYNRQASDTLVPIDIRDPINSAISMAERRYKDEAILTNEITKPIMINAELNQLSQVFLNLIINGVQATLNTQAKGNIKISGSQNARHAIISIQDNGTGIEKEHLKKIFDPFFTTKPIGVGTGLGMSVVYNILKAHSAEISVTSKISVGTEFIIRFPLSDLCEN
jgi:signal transduction histidine kinase